jgi:hypothetical protein
VAGQAANAALVQYVEGNVWIAHGLSLSFL